MNNWQRLVGQTCVVVIAFSIAYRSASAVTIEMVTVGNPANAPDTEVMVQDGTTGYGSVSHVFKIGKYEVTAGQYTEFLNAVANADPNGLYSPSMTSIPNAGANIQRTGLSPNYNYNVAPDYADRPVNFVSLWDAARFANWLHNGQPIGAQGPGTTEDGAYHGIGNESLFGRNPDAVFFIPSENEWYKAAYHDMSGGLAPSYSDYPTGTNSVPGRDMTEVMNPGNNANYRDGNLLIGSPYFRTNVGEFELSESAYGTFDQGGNVLEWTETLTTESSGVTHGGYFNGFSSTLRASNRDLENPSFQGGVVGFRVASVAIPEPSTLTIGRFRRPQSSVPTTYSFDSVTSNDFTTETQRPRRKQSNAKCKIFNAKCKMKASALH